MSLERHGSRLDPWVDAYAVRTRGMTSSEVRALFAVASRPEVVSLAGGMPYVAALPLEAVADAVARLLLERGTRALQYGSGQGDEWLRELIASEVLPTVGVHSHPDDVIVTVGSQQALDLITRVFVDPGDVILVEAPSYVTALSTFAAYQADVVHVAMDEQGLLPDALGDAIEAVGRAGKRAKFVYTIPSYHNPAGVTQGPERRREVLAVAKRAGLLLVEDDPYGLLGFDGVIPRAIRADEEDGVIYVGSFSKTFAPGLRVGFAVAPHGVREKLVLAAEASVLCPPAYSQLTVATYLATQPWFDQVKAFRELYRERRDALLESLTAHMPQGTTWTRPAGGFYSWVTLPGGLDASAMLPRAVTARVAYVPGTGFYSGWAKTAPEARSSMRLSYCYPEPERIREGVRRLAGVVEQELDLTSTFGPKRAVVTESSADPWTGLPSYGETPGPDLA
jgi:DNA-binding transcriptional MocR family regulator